MNNLIKYHIKNIIKESFINEDYPESFDMDFFKRLTNKSFKKRIEYCDQHLERIANGTSRIIYKINNENQIGEAVRTKIISIFFFNTLVIIHLIELYYSYQQ